MGAHFSVNNIKIKGFEGYYPVTKPISITTPTPRDRLTERIREPIRERPPGKPPGKPPEIPKTPVIKIPSLDLPDMEIGRKKGKKRKK